MTSGSSTPDESSSAVAPAPGYPFLSRLARILNAGQSRSVLLTGNVHDLFFVPRAGGVGGTGGSALEGDYLPLLPTLLQRFRVEGLARIVYELNGPIRFLADDEKRLVRQAWIRFRSGVDLDTLILKGLGDAKAQAQRESLERAFEEQLLNAVGKPTVALEFLRQLTLCSRSQTGADPFALLIIIEGADLLLPAGDGDLARLSAGDRHRIAVARDWFCDPGFMDGRDSVVLLADSRSEIHARVTGLPQMLAVEVAAPDQPARRHYIEWFLARSSREGRARPTFDMETGALARMTAGLSLHALRQLLVGAAHAGKAVTPADVIDQVEHFIIAQLGEGVVEFKRPTHTLDAVVGYTALRTFIRTEMIPRLRAGGEGALAGAAVAGPIGAGKTFIFEAMAGELGLPVLVLKNIRSQFFGQTDALFERLRRVLEALNRVVVFIDEADTQFGGVGAETHETERRLTGKLQQMMSDPALRGRVCWLLMTARIHRLSPDLRRPGRAGDLIIPVLDPPLGSADRRAFLRWVLAPIQEVSADEALLDRIEQATADFSAAGFAALRSRLKASVALRETAFTAEEVEAIIHDQLSADIGSARRYQTLQALVNCTRRGLLPDPDVDDSTRIGWREELRALERAGQG